MPLFKDRKNAIDTNIIEPTIREQLNNETLERARTDFYNRPAVQYDEAIHGPNATQPYIDELGEIVRKADMQEAPIEQSQPKRGRFLQDMEKVGNVAKSIAKYAIPAGMSLAGGAGIAPGLLAGIRQGEMEATNREKFDTAVDQSYRKQAADAAFKRGLLGDKMATRDIQIKDLDRKYLADQALDNYRRGMLRVGEEGNRIRSAKEEKNVPFDDYQNSLGFVQEVMQNVKNQRGVDLTEDQIRALAMKDPKLMQALTIINAYENQNAKFPRADGNNQIIPANPQASSTLFGTTKKQVK